MKNTAFVYHFRPAQMTGSVLYPLNRLREVQPEAYELQAKKYKGRETLLQKRIPALECLWNDVLHFSPIHPQIVLDTWRHEDIFAATRVILPLEVYKVPVTLLEEPNTICFQSKNFDFENFDSKLEEYSPFKKSQFQEQMEVEPAQIQVWKNDIARGRGMLWYSHTLHILAKQSIDVRECELVTCN